jgi:hypothetical protein
LQEKDKELKRYLKEGMRNRTLEHSSSEIASPLLFVKKKDGGLCICVDYRQLNEKVKKDIYTLPRINAILETLEGKRFYSKKISAMCITIYEWQITARN